MTSAQLQYAQHMVHLCETQADEWDRIANGLRGLLGSRAREKEEDQGEQKSRSATNSTNHSHPRPREAAQVAGAQPEVQPRPALPEAEDPDRARLRMRLAHIIRGLILIFALGLPRLFYYLYGVYAVFVLSGALDKLQSPEFRRLLSGSKPSLDVQLARLRQRMEMLAKLEQIESAMENDEPFDVDEFRRVNEFLQTFEPNERSWSSRFMYQLLFMFVYSALPACHPDPDFLK